jgi:hypothetical protein
MTLTTMLTSVVQVLAETRAKDESPVPGLASSSIGARRARVPVQSAAAMEAATEKRKGTERIAEAMDPARSLLAMVARKSRRDIASKSPRAMVVTRILLAADMDVKNNPSMVHATCPVDLVQKSRLAMVSAKPLATAVDAMMKTSTVSADRRVAPVDMEALAADMGRKGMVGGTELEQKLRSGNFTEHLDVPAKWGGASCPSHG